MKRDAIDENIAQFSRLPLVYIANQSAFLLMMSAQKNRLIETIILSTHILCFD